MCIHVDVRDGSNVQDSGLYLCVVLPLKPYLWRRLVQRGPHQGI